MSRRFSPVWVSFVVPSRCLAPSFTSVPEYVRRFFVKPQPEKQDQVVVVYTAKQVFGRVSSRCKVEYSVYVIGENYGKVYSKETTNLFPDFQVEQSLREVAKNIPRGGNTDIFGILTI